MNYEQLKDLMEMRIKDNSSYTKAKFITDFPRLTKLLADKTLANLVENNNLLIFPGRLESSADLTNDGKVLETSNDKIFTRNVIGIVGSGNERLVIHSRFSQGTDNYFLRYLLQRVLNVNLINLDADLTLEEQYYQLLVYLFPKYLNTALRKGVFKTYQRFEHNDTNLKGTIEIARHLKVNTPFMGKVAYSTREFSKDNDLMELIRHTIEYLKKNIDGGKQLLNLTERTKQNVQIVIQNTQRYDVLEQPKIIIANKMRPVRHAYFSEYRALQKLCLLILARQKHSFGQQGRGCYGILFDVSWLWEEYLNLVLQEKFIHPRNRKKQLGINLYSEMFDFHHNRTVYPDFYSQDHQIVLDAKYKQIATSISRNDLYQIITYAHILKTKAAGVIYPSEQPTKADLIGKLNGDLTVIFRQAVQVPQEVDDYQEFVEQFRNNEELVLAELMKVVAQSEKI